MAESSADEDLDLPADVLVELDNNKKNEHVVDMEKLEELRATRGHPFSILSQESITRAEEDDEVESEPDSPSDDDDDSVNTKNIDISTLANDGEKLLHAAEHNLIDEVEKILKANHKLARSTRDEDGYTPLHRASYSNHLKIIRLLLLHGADVNALTNSKWTPLHSAARWGNARAASLLIHNGANVNAVTDGGLTALHLAAEHAKSQRYRKILLLLLLNPFIDLEIKDSLGQTAHDVARKTFASKLFDVADTLSQ